MSVDVHFTRGLCVALALFASILSGCSKEPERLEIQKGSEVSLERDNGSTVAGRLVDVQPEAVVVETTNGETEQIPRADIRAVRAVPPAPAAEKPAAAVRATEAPPVPKYRDVEVPAGTTLSVEMNTTVASATSRVEDQVRGTLRRAISIDGTEVIPAGSALLGNVTAAERSGRVKGRARVAFRFTQVTVDDEPLAIRTAAVAREAQGTKKEDALKIGGGAAAGAVIGGIVGGGDGAAKGAAIGGGAGTGVVLATRGKDVTVSAGTTLSTTVSEPLVVRVRVR